MPTRDHVQQHAHGLSAYVSVGCRIVVQHGTCVGPWRGGGAVVGARTRTLRAVAIAA